jgi:hypothetical protein
VAIENAIEGCVRETYGALMASFQTCHARDPEIVDAMRGIARDETRHAALAWAIAEWASSHLSNTSNSRLRQAMVEGIRVLESEIESPDEELTARAGLPDAAEQRRLLDGLRRSLWEHAS